jgi:aminopeptidase N
MENVAAVTFSERYITRGEYSVTQRRSIASVIAHEMAHMWFGDLVTMKWWNGLWLNESFATYMSYLALAEASEFTNAWDAMYSSMKLWAYDTDQLVTTHPIELEVATSTNAFTNFDGITYGKGASVLKQLPFLLGEENFRLGVSNYLKKHAWGNTELNDFVSALAEASSRDLSRWQQEWLFESGVNTVQTAFTCEEGNVSSMKLIQRVPDLFTASQVLRSQRTQVALYRYTDETMVPAATLAVQYDGPVTHVPEAVGLPCPDLVFPNQNDQAFMKVRLDSKSRTTLRTRINSIPDATVRLMLWQALWEEVVDGVTPLTDFTTFVMQALPQENDLVITNLLADYLVESWSVFSRIDATGFSTQRRAIETFMHARLENAVPGSDAQKTWFGYAISLSHSPQVLDTLLSWLNGAQVLDGLPIDQDKRWSILLTLNRYAHTGYDELLEAEKSRDNSDIGTNMALAAAAIRPDAETKAQWTQVLTTQPEAYKLATMRNVMSRLFPAEQTGLLETHREELLSAIPGLVRIADLGYLSEYMETMRVLSQGSTAYPCASSACPT